MDETGHMVRLELIDQQGTSVFVVRGGDREESMEVSESVAQALDELGYLFLAGFAMNPHEPQSITAAVTASSNLLAAVLGEMGPEMTSLKCILANAFANPEGLSLSAKGKTISAEEFSTHFSFVAEQVFAAMRTCYAGDVDGSNVYRLVHCMAHDGDEHTGEHYAIFTILLQTCLFAYVCQFALTNPPGLEGLYKNGFFSLLVCIYQIMVLAPEIRGTIIVNRSDFWGGKWGILRVSDLLANVVYSVLLVPIGVLAVLTSSDTMQATLTSTALLFIPTIDNRILDLISHTDEHTVKKYVARMTLHDLAYYFFSFELNRSGGGMSNSPPTPKETLRQETSSFPIRDIHISGKGALKHCAVFDVNYVERKGPHGVMFMETYFSESQIITPNALFCKMQYALEDEPPHAVVRIKLWRFGYPEGEGVVDYKTKRHHSRYPSHIVGPGCFFITNLHISDCITHLRICYSDSGPELLRALTHYNLFLCNEAAQKRMTKRPPSSLTPLTSRGRTGRASYISASSNLDMSLSSDIDSPNRSYLAELGLGRGQRQEPVESTRLLLPKTSY